MINFSSVKWDVGGETPPRDAKIETTYGHIYDLMTDGGEFGERETLSTLQPHINHLQLQLTAKTQELQTVHRDHAAELESVRRTRPATPAQVRRAHRAVETNIRLAKQGLWAAALAFFAGAFTQVSPTVALGWCNEQQGAGAVAKCYTDGLTAIGVGILAGLAGALTWSASNTKYRQSLDGDAGSAEE